MASNDVLVLSDQRDYETIANRSLGRSANIFLQTIQVRKSDVTSIEKDFETAFIELKDNSNITCDHGISVYALEDYLDHLFDTLKSMGVTEEDRKKWNAIHYTEKHASHFDHFDYPDKRDKRFRYCFGMIAFVKSPDQETVSCYRAIYSLNFKLEERMLTNSSQVKTTSILWGLIKWEKPETPTFRRMQQIKTKDQERFNNFLQFKALKMFQRKGILDTISYR